jgi:MYXO-CTERM domain-containing protein
MNRQRSGNTNVGVKLLRFAMLAVVLMCLASLVSGRPTAGTDITPSSNTWWIHADDEFGAWMSNVRQEGTDPYVGWGPNSPTVAPPGVGSIITEFPLVPAPQNDILLDDTKPIAMDVWVGGGLGGHIFVTPALYVDGETLASGEELSGTFVDGDLLHFTWDLTARMDTIPAGAEVVWEFRLSGVYESAFYWMEEGRWTSVTLPVIDPELEPDATGGDSNTSSTSTTQPPTSSSSSSSSSRPSSSTSTTSAAMTSSPATSPTNQEDSAGSEPTSTPKETPVVAAPWLAIVLLLLVRRRR